MKLLKSTKRPADKRTCNGLDLQITAAYILEHVEIDCGFEIWHISHSVIPIFSKGPFSK